MTHRICIAIITLAACTPYSPSDGDTTSASSWSDAEATLSTTEIPADTSTTTVDPTTSEPAASTTTADSTSIATTEEASTGEPSTGPTPACGNAIVEAGEECDDGDQDDGDPCTNSCTLAVCGDSIIGPRETCDDGNAVDDDACTNACILTTCGDGAVQAGEACDDVVETPECNANCTPVSCGDSVVNAAAGEDCDVGGESPDCDADCTAASCGDGTLNASADETCDDGDAIGGDGCSADCTIECGNGVIDEGEECDDGNSDLADTCDQACKRLRFHVFVTSTKHAANFGGVTGADSLCNQLAVAADLPGAGNFKAWISAGGIQEAKSRLFHSARPYILLDNNKVADNWTDLTDGNLDYQINRTEANVELVTVPANCGSPETLVWTGTLANGSGEIENCHNWQTLDGYDDVYAGNSSRTDSGWTWGGCIVWCPTDQYRLYCIEQPPA